MKNRVTRKIVTVLFVLIVLLGAFLLYSSAINWTLFSVIVFWFFIVPPLSHFSAKLLTRHKENLGSAINGCLLFYTVIGLLIYFNYETAYLKLILMSIIPVLVTIYLFNIKDIDYKA